MYRVCFLLKKGMGQESSRSGALEWVEFATLPHKVCHGAECTQSVPKPTTTTQTEPTDTAQESGGSVRPGITSVQMGNGLTGTHTEHARQPGTPIGLVS
jgi:hypothetical protein